LNYAPFAGSHEAASDPYAGEKQLASSVFNAITTPLDAHGDPEVAKKFREGGYEQVGYGNSEGSAIHGTYAKKGNQGYYAEGGEEAFLGTVNAMKDFFKRRAARNGKPIRYIIKTGIGGQHTPFQGIASDFEILEAQSGKIVGEYELGKGFEASMLEFMTKNHVSWDEFALIPSSKSGSTDETMIIFVEIFYLFLKHVAQNKGLDGERFAQHVFKTLHDLNFDQPNGSERIMERKTDADKDKKLLFEGFSIDLVIQKALESGWTLEAGTVHSIFSEVLSLQSEHLFAFALNSAPLQSSRHKPESHPALPKFPRSATQAR
jgi:hypothetical protein